METYQYNQQSIAEIIQRFSRLEERLNKPQATELNWLDSHYICQLLHISKRTLDHYRDSGMLPYSKMGGRVYYRITDIDNYLTTNLVCKASKP